MLPQSRGAPLFTMSHTNYLTRLCYDEDMDIMVQQRLKMTLRQYIATLGGAVMDYTVMDVQRQPRMTR